MENLQVLLTLVITVIVHCSNKYDPGNTFTNCIQPVSCATCYQYKWSSGYRSIDGSCNNLRYPNAGSRNQPLKRLLAADYVDHLDTPRGFPGTKPTVPAANVVSDVLFDVEKETKKGNKQTVLFMTFGQFLDHDIGLATHASCKIKDCSKPDAFKYPCFSIGTGTGNGCSGFGRALPVCQSSIRKRFRKPRNQVNELTAFIDGSAIYGSFLRLNQRLRYQDGSGKLKITSDGLLPFDEERLPCGIRGGCSLAGDARNDENVALNSMHTLWVREHNRIATELKKINPSWGEYHLFETARKIVGAQLQHIVYNEWLPKITRLPPYKRYRRNLNPSIVNAFSTAAFRFGHSLIPNKFSMLNANFDKAFDDVELQQAFRNRALVDARGIEPVLFGLLGNKSNPVDMGMAFGIRRKLFIEPGKKGRMDLAAFNIQRGRDHGIPTYGAWRRFCRFRKQPKTFAELEKMKIMMPGSVEKFKKIYKSPKDIDLFAAGLAERHVKGLLVGPTFECLIRHQFLRLRDGDRYFYKSHFVFKPAQRAQINKASMARVLCDNMKGIVSIQPQAFTMADTKRNKRIACGRIPKMDLKAWKSFSFGK